MNSEAFGTPDRGYINMRWFDREGKGWDSAVHIDYSGLGKPDSVEDLIGR